MSQNIVKFHEKYTTCCEYSELYKDGVEILSGDVYHNKITDKIEAYLMSYDDMGIKYEYTSEEYEICPYFCD